jgi:hypothetical protein
LAVFECPGLFAARHFLERNAVALTQLDAFCHTRDVREEIMAAEIGDDEAVQLRSARNM